MKESKEFEEILRNSLKEAKLRKRFLISNEFVIDTMDECEEVCELILEDVLKLIQQFQEKLFSLAFQKEVMKESDNRLSRYLKNRVELQKIIDEIETLLSKIEIYLAQVKIPSGFYSLGELHRTISKKIRQADGILPDYENLKFVPGLDDWYKMINTCIRRYNRYVDVFNQRNTYVKENIPAYFNMDLPILSYIENLKNWNPI